MARSWVTGIAVCTDSGFGMIFNYWSLVFLVLTGYNDPGQSLFSFMVRRWVMRIALWNFRIVFNDWSF